MNRYVFTAIAVMAVVTYLIRMLPLTLMRRKIKSVFLRSVLAYVPYAVLTAMTVPFILYCRFASKASSPWRSARRP